MPAIRFFHGRLDRPIRLFDPAAGWASPGGFLGILPRALSAPVLEMDGADDPRLLMAGVERIIDAGIDAPDGATLRDVLNGLHMATAAESVPTDEALRTAHRLALRSGMLTLRESADVAAHAARQLCEGDGEIQLAAVREGHTASVWRMQDASGCRRCILVPRDREADAEQLSSLAPLEAIRRRAPEAVICRERRLPMPAPARLGGEVVILATEWLDDAHELNVVEDELCGPAMVAVRTFEGRAWAGVRLGAAEAEEAAAAMRAILLAGTEELTAGQFTMPTLEVNDGDFVLQGGRVRAVAASAPAPALDAAKLIAAYAAFGGRSARDGRPLPIGPPDRLADELARGLSSEALRVGARALIRGKPADDRSRRVAEALLGRMRGVARRRPPRAG